MHVRRDRDDRLRRRRRLCALNERIPRDYALEWSGALGCILAGIALLMRKLPTGVKLSKEMKEIA